LKPIQSLLELLLVAPTVWAADNQLTEAEKKPHRFGVAWKDHPRKGHIGLQDHGKDCWFKNIRLKPLPD